MPNSQRSNPASASVGFEIKSLSTHWDPSSGVLPHMLQLHPSQLNFGNSAQCPACRSQPWMVLGKGEHPWECPGWTAGWFLEHSGIMAKPNHPWLPRNSQRGCSHQILAGGGFYHVNRPPKISPCIYCAQPLLGELARTKIKRSRLGFKPNEAGK